MRGRAPRPAPRGAAIPPRLARIAKRGNCQVCGAEYGKIHSTEPTRKRGPSRIWVPRQHLDHILPLRWCRQHGYEPNVADNCVSVCHRCNLQKVGAENALFAGRPLDYIKLLVQRGWTPFLTRAFKHYEMASMLKLLRRTVGFV